MCEFEGGTEAREVHSSVDQTKKAKTKNKVFSTNIFTNFGYRLKILAIFHDFLSKEQKKSYSSQKFRCESTKITKKQFLLSNSRAVNTNLGVLGLHLHSSSPEPVNFFGAQSSLGGGHNFRLGGGHKQSFGGHGPGMPPSRGAGFAEQEFGRPS